MSIDLAELLGGQQHAMSDEQIAAVTVLHARQHAMALEGARTVRRFAAILCGCRAYFDWDDRTPPQYGCVVHGQLAIDPHTGEIL